MKVETYSELFGGNAKVCELIRRAIKKKCRQIVSNPHNRVSSLDQLCQVLGVNFSGIIGGTVALNPNVVSLALGALGLKLSEALPLPRSKDAELASIIEELESRNEVGGTFFSAEGFPADKPLDKMIDRVRFYKFYLRLQVIEELEKVLTIDSDG